MKKPSPQQIQNATKQAAEILYTARGIATPRKYTAAIIAAAGNSTRMGGDVSKQRMLLRGIPVLAQIGRAHV